ncbi:uncharacterized protein isoform X2 [Musca autumnalis]|uniref:uncharacterized protein isoform X2 n=1 Tax=Musca autumnalis TaxID=221902 RepID=UPI003CF2466C
MTFYKIAFNSDVMIHIYKLLSFGDQLRLAQVDANLRSIFLQYISPICYNKLTVRKLERGYYMVSNGMDTDRSWIQNSSDFEQFQQFYGSTVCDLFAYIPVRMEFFKNLVKLDCYYIYTITQDAMVQLTNNLPNLEELQVYAVEFETEPPNDCIARAIVNELLRFPKLKKLVLNVLICSYEIKFKDFYEIVTQLPLEIIEINFPILFDTDDNELELQQSPLPLMQLETECCNEMLRALNRLTQLHQLTICNTDFCEEANIILPPNLTALHLDHCFGLLLDHLQQFLQEKSYSKLIEFVTIGTDFRIKEFKELHISSRIKILNIEGFNLNQFHSPFVENSALENLTWHGFGRRFAMFNSISLCHNLHTLDMRSGYLALETLLNCTNLKKLSLDRIMPDQEFYVIHILQDLPLLRELVVQQIVKSSCTSLQAVVTCVSSIKIIGFEHFDDILGFWFDMFSLNPQLELQLQCDVHDRNRLQYLTQHEKFPRNLRKIQIFGFTVDCSKLRNNFESVWKTISYPLEDYENDHPYRSECNIIMSRNTKLM